VCALVSGNQQYLDGIHEIFFVSIIVVPGQLRLSSRVCFQSCCRNVGWALHHLRLTMPDRILVRNYAGGHMAYLDDASRITSRVGLQVFYRGTLKAAPLSAPTINVFAAPAKPLTSGVVILPLPEVLQTPLRDPWVPATQRTSAPPPPASQGLVLQSEIDARKRELRQRDRR
jgi:hypothetical protein